ncbi:hypothetical protein TrLO_g10575 [Triparma laevis f. longispina]|uniref:Uncharacterized protein n=1 Tax=Triparma laevis f. longispina TaxID=1714387 RepID=A0A9W7FU05_9STRA|nr:hypothetical protein TrLO_g10575 [Triparma laevis f. longispina]
MSKKSPKQAPGIAGSDAYATAAKFLFWLVVWMPIRVLLLLFCFFDKEKANCIYSRLNVCGCTGSWAPPPQEPVVNPGGDDMQSPV